MIESLLNVILSLQDPYLLKTRSAPTESQIQIVNLALSSDSVRLPTLNPSLVAKYLVRDHF
jgi:hypothetical protein